MTEKRLSIKKLYIILLTLAVTALLAATVFACVNVKAGVRAADKKVTEISINIDFGNYDGRNGGKNLPHGKAGKSYPVFSCSATDNNGDAAKQILITVSNPSNNLVPQAGGRFKTETKGEYIVKYVAISGAVSAEKVITVTVDEYAADIVYDNAVENLPAEGVTGSAVFAVFGSFSGGAGDLTHALTLKLGEEESEVTTTESGVYFIPEKCGEYELSYKATDITGDEKVVSKKITVTDSETPSLDIASIPSSAIAGETLELPHANGVLYKNGKKYYLPVKVAFDKADVTESLKAENLTAGEHTVVYTCASPLDATKKVEHKYTVIVKDKTVIGDERIYDKYFDLTGFTADTENKKAYSVKAAKADNAFDASIKFSRALPIAYADLELSATASFASFDEANFVLTDSKNAGEQVKVKIHGLTAYESVWLSYDDENKVIVNKNGGAVIAKIDTYANGIKFKGFTSGKVYVSLELKNVAKDIYVSINKVGSTTVTTSAIDYAPPVFNDNPGFRAVYVSYLGHTVNLPKMTAFDILDKNVTVTLAVRKPDGSLVYEGDDGYALSVAESGEYSVEYTATDSANNIRKLISSVYVTDLVSPTIEVGGIAKTVKAGDEITLPKATITDNDTAAENIISYVYVLKGNNRKEIVGETYKFTTAGEYKIRYVAYDVNQNYTVVEFTVICK